MKSHHHQKMPQHPGPSSSKHERKVEKAPRISIFINNTNNLKQPLTQQQEQQQQQKQRQDQSQKNEAASEGCWGLFKKFCCGS